MQFINKTINEGEGMLIINSLLEDAWNEEDSRYIGADYNGLCHPFYKIPLVTLLLAEQQYLCCYCMKKLTGANNDTTIEHIIPQNVLESDFNNYITSPLLSNIIQKNVFIRNERVLPINAYPHDIAYNNLIASCDSKTHCNNFRGNAFVEPFVYDIDIEQKVVYDKLGLIDCDEYQDSFYYIGITTNALLQRIRRIWKILTPKIDSEIDISEAFIEEEIYQLTDEPDYPKLISDFTGNSSLLGLLIKYKWFYHYYRNN